MSDGRYVYETKLPLQLCWLATIGTQEGRIAHHHTDATVLRMRSGRAEHRTSWLYLVPPFTLPLGYAASLVEERYEDYFKLPNFF
jgi:hypothetical protein